MPFHGISRKGNYTGQYVYDPTFGENENSEQEEYFSEIPFMSYISSTQKTQECKDKEMGYSTPDEKKRPKTQNKTPRTMLRMMERHRENERVRHHTLNNSMKKVCDRVPGASPFMKETKVVMMQRIIAYICFLENTINSVCTHLGIKQLRMSSNFITDQWTEEVKRRNGSIVIKRKQYSPTAKKFEFEKQRLKVSSPTIDSTTTDNINHTVTQEMVANSQDSQGVSSTYKVEDNIFMDDNACCVPEHYEDPYLNEDFLPTTSKLDNFPDAFDLLSSPVGNLPHHHTIDSSDECGIKEDKDDFDVIDSPLRTISPESILPTALSQSSTLSEDVPSRVMQYRNKRRNPFRSPFDDITNLSSQNDTIKSEPVFSKECPVDENFVSYVPYIYNFHKSAVSRRKRCDQTPQPSLSVLESKANKIDHRKTTWMNGFMMFSRLNRRSFIEANPGVHTSHISKMMGHAWRQMTSDDQLPYREKAKDFAESMKNLVCDESSDSD